MLSFLGVPVRNAWTGDKLANVTRTMQQHRASPKDYYRILGLAPNATPEAVRGAYQRLTRLYGPSPATRLESATAFSVRAAQVEEAYVVLSDPVRRAAYDRIFQDRRGYRGVGLGEDGKDSIVEAMALVAEQMSTGAKTGRASVRSRLIRRAILIGAVVPLCVLVAGSAFAFASPQSVLAAPFRDVATSIAETSSVAAVRLIEEVRGVVAMYERNIISTSVQAMRVTEDVRQLPVVTVSTNDMTRFPSPEHSLFPHYLDRRFSQFKYTIDSDGIVTVDKSTATTDAFLKRIRERLNQVKADSSLEGGQPAVPVAP